MNTHDPPIAISVSDATAAAGIGRTKLFALIRDGEIPARKIGARTIILRSDLERWLKGLPTVRRD